RFGEAIHLLRDPTRGGVASVLNELARDSRLGITLREGDIPVDQQVAGACELLGLDPLYVANEGVFIAIVDAAVADEVVRELRADAACASAVCIGTVVDEHVGKVIMESRIGGRRVVNMLA